MAEKKCYVCGKSPLSKDEIGLTKKLIDKKTTNFYCLSCLAESLEVTEEELARFTEEERRGMMALVDERRADIAELYAVAEKINL